MTALRNFLVLLAAGLICMTMFPLGALSTLIISIRTADSQRPIDYLANTSLRIALSLDLLGNVVCKDLFNHTLIKPDSHPFGDPRETISSVLGKNKATSRLTDAGRALTNFLNWLEPDHVEKAAQTPNPQ